MILGDGLAALPANGEPAHFPIWLAALLVEYQNIAVVVRSITPRWDNAVNWFREGGHLFFVVYFAALLALYFLPRQAQAIIFGRVFVEWRKAIVSLQFTDNITTRNHTKHSVAQRISAIISHSVSFLINSIALGV